MADVVALDLVSKRLVTDQLVLTVGYDIKSLTNPDIRDNYHGDVTTDHHLSDIVGDISASDTLQNIFRHFCIGK